MDDGEQMTWDAEPLPPILLSFSSAIDKYPAGFTGNPLNLLFLNDAEPIQQPREFLWQLDAPSLMDERRQYVMEYPGFWPFPAFDLSTRPDPLLVSQRLFERYDDAPKFLKTQRNIGRLIERKVREHKPDVVALLIADGLSYYDLPEQIVAEPCLVDGVSITEVGYRQVVGNPELSRLMFTMGYRTQYGFTYYPTDQNSLAAEILSRFAVSQTTRVRTFEEILVHLDQVPLGRSYIQISLPGLDHLAHAHHDKPPRNHYLHELLERFQRLIDQVTKKKRKILACLTSDHGILWREHIEDKIQIVRDLLPEDSGHARYVRGRFVRDFGRCCTNFGQNYTLLRMPCMTRNLKSNEWGVHGGISAWESIVPLITKIVG